MLDRCTRVSELRPVYGLGYRVRDVVRVSGKVDAHVALSSGQ